MKPTRVLQLGVGRVGAELDALIRGDAGQAAGLVPFAQVRRGRWRPEGEADFRPLDDPREALGAALAAGPDDLVVADVTAAETADLLLEALQAGAAVATANKLPVAGPMATWRDLHEAAGAGARRLGYECTVGAALPVTRPLRGMRASGDEVKGIQGALSGTLGFLMTSLDEGSSFSAAVRRAHAQGLTEPDPREDLSGRDVQRKAVILARLAGLEVEPDEVPCEDLSPAGSERDSLEDFLSRLESADPSWAAMVASAGQASRRLRYLATVGPEGARVGLEEVPLASPWGALAGPDNQVVIRTSRYHPHPLVVRGPGAGVALTAAGVFEDILEVRR